MGWTSGTKIKVRFLAKKNVSNKYPNFGLYHYLISAAGYTFAGGGGTVSRTLSRIGDWEVLTAEFITTADWEMNNHSVTLYLYGTNGDEGRLWIDSVEVAYWNP
jgi:hypothetical protein